MSNYINNFIKCGLTGWCMECFWTGLISSKKHDKKLMCQTSLWMFPIYGSASLFTLFGENFSHKNPAIRGLTYMLLIFGVELLTGSILKKHEMCPWDYTGERHNYRGIIRLDYAPVWFIVGLFFEKYVLESSDRIDFFK